LELGLEILAQDLFPCAVMVKTDRTTQNYQPALLVQTSQLDEVQTSLIVPGSNMYREKQTIHLRLGDESLLELKRWLYCFLQLKPVLGFALFQAHS
jgi:cyclic-di-GMP-binding protein